METTKEINQMETNSYTKTCDLELAEQIARKADRINKRAERNDLNGRITVTTENAPSRYTPVTLLINNGYGNQLVTATDFAGNIRMKEVPMVHLTVEISGVFTIGDYTPVALVEFIFSEDGEPESIIKSVGDVQVLRDVHPSDCDHCHAHRNRNSIWVVANKAGEQFHVGSTCVADFLGIDDMYVIKEWQTMIVSGLEDHRNELEDDEQTRKGQRLMEGEAHLVKTVLESIYATMVQGKYVSAKNATAETLSTKQLVEDSGSDLVKLIKGKVDHEMMISFAVEAINYWKNIEVTNDFEANLNKIARNAEGYTKKFAGFACYMAEGFRREFVKFIEMANSQAERSEIPAELTNGQRHEISGTVLSVKNTYSYGNEVIKMRVEDDRGFVVWGTNNMNAEVGDRGTFTATVCKSDNDPTFGFFKRPKVVS